MIRVPSTVLRMRWGNKHVFLLVVILAFSAYTHMWNPAGFPILKEDEGVYMERAVGILDGQVLYGKHDHPFFGQIVIAGFMHVTGYPDLFDDPQTDPSYLEALYAYPRAFMGLLAVIDTLLVYLIADRVFGRRVATVSSVLFAATLMSIDLRMIMLDSILLPFVLSSVLLALHACGSDRKHAVLIASGVCMGLAILTKVPAVAMVPLCAILAYSASGRIRDVGVWFAPAVAIPAIWPAYAAWAGQFDMWIGGVLWQAGRSNDGLPAVMGSLFKTDPVLMPLGMAGFVFAVSYLILRLGRERGATGRGEPGDGNPSHDPLASSTRHSYRILGGAARASRGAGSNVSESRRYGFLVVWFSPILLFFGAIGFVSYWHLSMLLPALCIAAAVLILVAGRWRITRGAGGWTEDRVVLAASLAIGLVGMSTAGVLVHLDTQSPAFDAASFMLQNLDDPNAIKILPTTLFWVLSDVYGIQNATTYVGYGGQKGAERILLAISDHKIDHYSKLAEPCNDPAVPTDHTPVCRDHPHIVNMLEIYGEGSLIREFGHDGGLIGALPTLPDSVERRLTNPYKITGLSPAM